MRLAKLYGSSAAHPNAGADELFYVVAGRLRTELREQEDLVLEEGDLAVVPAGVEHRPIASPGCRALFIERRGTTNTGDGAAEGTTAYLLGSRSPQAPRCTA